MAIERRAWLVVALLLAACGGGDEAATDPLAEFDEDGNPIAPAAQPAAAGAARRPPIVLAEVDTNIVREVYTYGGGTRDPFVSLLGTTVTGPELTDLELSGIYYVTGNPAQSVAVLRERVSGRRHSVRTGQWLGRLYVTEIGPQDIWFTIDDFGVQRRETLTLRKQEEGIR